MTAYTICIRVLGIWTSSAQFGDGKIKNRPNSGEIQKTVAHQCVIWLMARTLPFLLHEHRKSLYTFMQRIFAGIEMGCILNILISREKIHSNQICYINFISQFSANSIQKECRLWGYSSLSLRNGRWFFTWYWARIWKWMLLHGQNWAYSKPTEWLLVPRCHGFIGLPR